MTTQCIPQTCPDNPWPDEAYYRDRPRPATPAPGTFCAYVNVEELDEEEWAWRKEKDRGLRWYRD